MIYVIQIFYAYLRKMSENCGQFSSTVCANIILFLCQILFSAKAVLENLPYFRDNFLR